MSKRIIVVILMILLPFVSQTLFSKTNDIKQVVIFGDSYSDNGNTYKRSSNTYPGRAYFLGHFTNGPNWADYLAIKLGFNIMNTRVYRNYAYGQGQILGGVKLSTHNNTKSWSFSVPDFSEEVDEYFHDGAIEPAKSLYFVFIGTNDILNNIPTSKQNNQEFINKILDRFVSQVERLKKAGAKRIIIFNFRDLKLFPLSKQLAKNYKSNYLESLEEMIQQFNQGLLNLYSDDKNVHIFNIYNFDHKVFSIVNSIQWKSQKIFLIDKEQACYKHGGNYIDYIDNKYCTTPWTHWFFDRIHPTTYIDFMLSNDVYSFLINRKLV